LRFRVHYTHPWSATYPPMLLVTPELNVPPPFRMTAEEITDLCEKASRAFSTVEFLQANGLGEVTPTEEDKKEARALFTDSPVAEQEIRTPGKALMLRALLSEYDFEVVRNAAQVRRYIQLKLLEKTDCGDNKTELRALEMLGKMSDVGAFAERVEINVTHRTTEELENDLATKLAQYMGDIIDVEAKDLKVDFDPLPQAPSVEVIDLDEELGVLDGELDDEFDEELDDEVITDD